MIVVNVRIEDACIRDIERGGVEFLKHDLSHALPVLLCVPRRLSHENGMLGWVTAHHIVECI